MATGIPWCPPASARKGRRDAQRKHPAGRHAGGFAAQIAALFEKPDIRAPRPAGRALVQAKFSWETVNGIFEGYCRQACELGKKRK